MKTGTSALQEPTFLQQARHLLILPFSRLPLQTELPKHVTSRLGRVVEPRQALLDVVLHRRDSLEVERLRLPPLDITNDLGCSLALSEVDHSAGESVGVTILDKLKRRKEDTCISSDKAGRRKTDTDR